MINWSSDRVTGPKPAQAGPLDRSTARRPRPSRFVFRLLFSVFCLLFSLSSAQSFFNSRALGELVLPADARVAGFGAPSALSYENPGILVDLSSVSFTGTALAAAAIGEQAGRTRFVENVRPAGFHAAAPLPLDMRLMLGVDERFNQDFDLWSEPTADTSYRYHVFSHGGVYALRCGVGWSFLRLGAVGLEYNRLLGSGREDWQFEVANGRYVSTDTVELDYSGNLLRFGGSLQTDRFTFASHYTPGFSMTVNSVRHIHGVIEDSIRTYGVHIPGAVSFGASISPFERVTAVLGYELRPWSTMAVDGLEMVGVSNSYRVSAGAEYLTGQIPVRFGYSYSPWYFLAQDSSPIAEHRLHLGCSLPVKGFGSLGLSAEVGRRSSAALSETSIRLMLSLAYHEAWLKRTRRWGY